MPKANQKFAKSLPKVGPKLVQSMPKVSPRLAQGWSKVGPKLVQSWPKVGSRSAQSRPKVGQKSAQGGPKVGPKSAQVRPKVQKIISKYINLAAGGLKSPPEGRASIRIFARVCLLPFSTHTEPLGPKTAQINRKSIENRVFRTSGYYLLNYFPMDP